ncbi:unnamed protein product, partial [Mesorhabditis belari]|uniref:Uncharacterized protein n=1 Tax=Mesorhabditis belari TaxID=2138241 RepID=A0AAF3J3N4_9BILA
MFDDGVQDYVLNRLITGLSSSRAAARVGFSCALVHCLQKYPKRWKCDDLWKLCEDKLPLNDKDQSQANAIGRYLLLDSLFASEVYKNNFKWIAEKQLALAARFQWLSMGVWQSKTNSVNVTHLIEVLISSADKTNQFAEVVLF